VKLQAKTGRIAAAGIEISLQRSRNRKSLGLAPFDPVSAYASSVPQQWRAKDSLFVHLLPDEDLWIGLSGDDRVFVEFNGATLEPRPPNRWIEGTAEHPIHLAGESYREMTIHIGPDETLTVYLVSPELYRKITGRAPRRPTPDTDTYGGYLLP
jgi:hypothetical protein